MDVSTWIAFVAASTALLLVPGPTVLLVLSYALSHGRRVAVATAAGVAAGDLLAMTASLAGLGAVVLASATVFTVLKWAGAVYLVWLGLRLVVGAGQGGGLAPGRVPRREARAVFGHAAAVTALNPKSIVFFIAFVPQFVDPGAALLPQVAVLVATFVSLAAVNALAYALAADRLRARIGRPGVIAWLRRIGGGALVAMGAGTAALQRAG
jgi:threonine/homoserine/homoserine lactone efflux protein